MRIVAIAALLAASCATAPPAEAGAGRCDASKAQKLLGRTKSAKLGSQALRLSGATALRWIGPGTMVTMDFREDRINLRVDPKHRVVKIDCG